MILLQLESGVPVQRLDSQCSIRSSLCSDYDPPLPGTHTDTDTDTALIRCACAMILIRPFQIQMQIQRPNAQICFPCAMILIRPSPPVKVRPAAGGRWIPPAAQGVTRDATQSVLERAREVLAQELGDAPWWQAGGESVPQPEPQVKEEIPDDGAEPAEKSTQTKLKEMHEFYVHMQGQNISSRLHYVEMQFLKGRVTLEKMKIE